MRWVVDLKYPRRLPGSGKVEVVRESVVVRGATAADAVEQAFSRAGVLAHRQGVVADVHLVNPLTLAAFHSRYEHPEACIWDMGQRKTTRIYP